MNGLVKRFKRVEAKNEEPQSDIKDIKKILKKLLEKIDEVNKKLEEIIDGVLLELAREHNSKLDNRGQRYIKFSAVNDKKLEYKKLAIKQLDKFRAEMLREVLNFYGQEWDHEASNADLLIQVKEFPDIME